MSKPTAQERLAKTRKRVKEAIADAQRTLHAAEAAAREEARQAHRQHLWTLARLLDATGLSVYQAEELAPHFTALAAELDRTRGEAVQAQHTLEAVLHNGVLSPGSSHNTQGLTR